MYNSEVPKIREYVYNKGPEGVVDVGRFVIASIRTKFVLMHGDVRDIKYHGGNSKALWGFKRASYKELIVNSRGIYEKVFVGHGNRTDLLANLTYLHGFGLPKAGFMLQLLGVDTGCLDTHNLREFKVNPQSIKIDVKAKHTTRLARTVRYNSLIDDIGGSEFLWNNWCEFIGKANFITPNEISAMHYRMITDG